jgi:hypothetical protein
MWPIHSLTLYNHLKNPQIKLCGFISTELKITQVIIEKDFIYPETFKQRKQHNRYWMRLLTYNCEEPLQCSHLNKVDVSAKDLF